MNLYWVTTEDHHENWFIIASSSEEACKFHVMTNLKRAVMIDLMKQKNLQAINGRILGFI